MNDTQQKAAAKKFAEYWKDKGYEKGESQKFWIDLLEHVYGVENITEFICFEDQVRLDHTSFIDGFIPSTHVLIEQKGLGKDLRKGIKQSDGSVLSPFQQAKRYASELPYSQRPRWIVTCNFSEFLVYDMEKPNGEPEQILLKDLPKEYYRLQFLVNTGSEHIKKEMEVSLQAGELVGKLYNAILKQYKHPDSKETLQSLNMLCVRLVFCLYAEDAGIFASHTSFYDYLKDFSPVQVRGALKDLFRMLDTNYDDRDEYDETKLSKFPYVNGGLFRDDNIEIPNFNEEILDLLLEQASEGFDWSMISPTIFGAVFESTLNPETRRSGGMHYTSIENIHKVIDPLFLDELRAEFEKIKASKRERRKSLEAFQMKLAGLTFLDPACGSGNFLTETYISLRRLENEILKEIYQDQIQLGFEGAANPIKVSIGQFYGIEINDFAVTVAKTALWIAESQMLKETEEIVHTSLDFLPLKSYANIVEGNALRVDWESVVPKDKLDYIMGNPPFIGSARLSEEQKKDRETIFESKGGELDYVACWYKKAADYIGDLSVKCAFVSTNSICQGQQVYPLWNELMASGIRIDFAHRTFRWDSEASVKAHVYCIIIGFSRCGKEKCRLYDNGIYSLVDNINGYLVAAPSVFIEKRRLPLSDVPVVIKGFQPTDNGYLILSDEEKADILSKEPQAEKWIRPFITAKEYIHGQTRWCLWLVGISPNELNQLKHIRQRVADCREWRYQQVITGDAYKLRDIPTLMRPNSKFKECPYIVLPLHTGESRKYIPFGFSDNGSIPGNSVSIVPDATMYHFGILCSNVHMAWMRAVCGRIKSDYRYASDIVYNNFPWCTPTPEQKAKIEQTAQAILDARAKYPDCSLADLYDELTMPVELCKAHQANDFAVMAAYGFPKNITESECVAELMKMYQQLTENK
ncbi:MAG: SAM-dependent DNA methyltransferase [Ruminococcaceae bacterium]|nr:SAM-dependent DNA methyltransferase [Oscillospiraceae bacterium]